MQANCYDQDVTAQKKKPALGGQWLCAQTHRQGKHSPTLGGCCRYKQTDKIVTTATSRRQMTQNARCSARAAYELRPSGVLIVQLRGLLTADALLAVKADVVRDYSGADIGAFLADYRAAVVAMDGAGLDRILEGEDHGAVPSLPAAMIVQPELLELFSGHCERMAARGVVRAAFGCQVSAVVWAHRQAQRKRSCSAAGARAARPAVPQTQPTSPVAGG